MPTTCYNEHSYLHSTLWTVNVFNSHYFSRNIWYIIKRTDCRCFSTYNVIDMFFSLQDFSKHIVTRIMITVKATIIRYVYKEL